MSLSGGLGGFFGSQAASSDLESTMGLETGLTQNINPQIQNIQPWVTTGGNGTGMLGGGLGLVPGMGTNSLGSLWANTTFNSSNMNANNLGQSFTQSPGYAFAQGQADAGVQNSAAASGGLLSGNTTQAIGNTNTQLANQDYYQYLSSQYQGLGDYYNTLLGTGSLLSGVSAQGLNAGESQLGAETNVTTADMSAQASLGAANANAQSSGIGSLFSGIGSLFGI